MCLNIYFFPFIFFLKNNIINNVSIFYFTDCEENDLEKKELKNSNQKNKEKEYTLDDSTKSNSKIKGVKIIENYNKSKEYEKELNNDIIFESNTSNHDNDKINYVKDIILIEANNGIRLINLNLNYFGFSKNLNKPNDNDFLVKNKDRIAQIIIASVTQADFVITDNLSKTERGSSGFGSTGV